MRFTAKKLAVMAVLVAVSVVLVYLVHFPLFPAAAYLEYDPADIPILIGAFLYGPVAGLILTAAASVIQAFTVSAQNHVYGLIMHILATGTLTTVSSLIYRRRKTRRASAQTWGRKGRRWGRQRPANPDSELGFHFRL